MTIIISFVKKVTVKNTTGPPPSYKQQKAGRTQEQDYTHYNVISEMSLYIILYDQVD